MSDALWRAVFGNDRPVEIEIGPGRGDVLLAYAAADPSTNFYGIEIRRAQADALNARAAARALSNVFVIAADARCVVTSFVPAASVTAYHVYFPDPWPKTRHRSRRLFQPDLPAAMARTLVAGGCVHLASDLAWLFEDACAALARAGFEAVPPSDTRPRPITKFERKYAAGRTWAGVFRRPQVEAGSPRPQKTS
jgi:tRNA (guanine-N7-)-methyltransferase